MSHLPEWLGKPTDDLSASIGFAADQIRLLIALFGAIPLGQIMKVLPGATLKHIFSVFWGIFFCFYVVGWGFLHVLASALIVYVLSSAVHYKSAPTTVFLLSMLYMSAIHIHRLITDYGGYSLDSSLLLMVWTVKSVTYAYNIADGKALNAGERLSEKEPIHTFREARALRATPSFLEYLSYVFFFGGSLVGPCFEMKEFLDFVDGQVYKQAGLTSAPSSIFPVIRCIFYAIMAAIPMQLGAMYFPVADVISDRVLNSPAWYRFMFFMIATTCARFRYYFVWKLSEAGCVASGLGFNGVTKHKDHEEIKWDRTTNCNMVAVETSVHLFGVTNNWNIGVNNWLKNYVYFRVTPPKAITKIIPAKSFSNIVTKATSAFWHGFYSGYYVFFLGAWLINEMDDALRAAFEKKDDSHKHKRPFLGFLHWYTLYDFLSWVINMFHLNYLGTCFLLLEAGKGLQFWKSVYFFGFWVPLILIPLSKALTPRKPREPKKDAAATPAAVPAPTTPAPVAAATPAVEAEAEASSSSVDNDARPTRRRSSRASRVEDDDEAPRRVTRSRSRGRSIPRAAEEQEQEEQQPQGEEATTRRVLPPRKARSKKAE